MRRSAFWPLIWRRHFRFLLVFSVLAAMAWLCWKGARSPAIPLLPPGDAEWIVYPSPPHAEINSERDVSADFARQLVLAAAPARADLSWRAFRQSEVSINGVALPSTGKADWKDVSRINAASYLRAGTNTIAATVWNDNGPPALSLHLTIDGAAVNTDEDWSVSVAGSLWHPARPASASAKFGEGNELHGLEETGAALRECWPRLCLLLVVAVLLAGGLEYAFGGVEAVATGWETHTKDAHVLDAGFRRRDADGCERDRRHNIGDARFAGSRAPRKVAPRKVSNDRWWWLVVGAAGVWALLFLHNSPLLPREIGFDGGAHLEYITYIQEHWSLPSPKQGWEMFQGPLYYVLSACLLGAGHLRASEAAGIQFLRCLSVLIGAVNVALIFASLRLIFPGQWKKQMGGALLAAFLPAQICLLHYTTNETLSATLMSAAFYLCLRIVRSPAASAGLHAGLGCVLGLALLAKVSAIVFLPVVFGALAGKLILERRFAAGLWVRTVGLAGFFLLLVAGWRYAGVWRDFGNPLIGNWDARVASPWWQDPGCHTAGYFFSFGHALTAPLFSGFDSFWDCFYTTLWGDGLAGGAASTTSLPPWNYPLMDAGFLLALGPSALVLTGLWASVARCLREPDLVLLLLLGAAWSAAFAILYMSLKLAFYSQSKCFYGLPALLPLCVFGVLGLDFWARRGRCARAVLGVALLLWLCNVYASFWIRPGALQTELYGAVAQISHGVDEQAARRAVDRVLRTDPGNETGVILQSREDAPAAAVERLRRALRSNPGSGEIAKFLASSLCDLGQTNEALAVAQRAFALEPENLQAATQACALATQLGKNQEALDAGRAALGLDPGDPMLQFDVGCAWANLRYPVEAIRQFQMLLALKPPPSTEAQAHFYLGRLLSSEPGRKEEAISHFQAALRLEPGNSDCRQALDKLLPGG
jgi:tetratricopeptide (TPR) repeat protein